MIESKYFGGVVLLIAGVMLSACEKDDTASEQQVQRTFTLSIDAAKGVYKDDATNRAATRALTLIEDNLNASWATTEHVYVQGQLLSDKSYFWFQGSIQPQSAGKTTRLNGTISLPEGWTISIDDAIVKPHVLDLQFPRSGNLDYTGQIGTFADIAAKYDYAIAESVRFDIVGDHIEGVESADFVNQQAIVQFRLYDNAAVTDVPISAKSLTVSAAGLITTGESTGDITIEPASPTNEIWAALRGITDTAVTLTATVGDDTYTFTQSGVTFENGKFYIIDAYLTKQ